MTKLLYKICDFQVRIENKTQYLSSVCMTCLEGWGAGRRLRCLYCATPWDGSSLVIGTMYSYDIFAAMPCCTERLRVSVFVCFSFFQISIQRETFFTTEFYVWLLTLVNSVLLLTTLNPF